MLKYAYNNTPYYHECIYINNKNKHDLSLSDFPILHRDLLVENRNNIISREFYGRDFPSFYVTATSGTTGMPVIVYWDNNDYILSNLQLWRLRKIFYNITPKAKMVKFTNKSDQVLYYQNNILYVSKHFIVTHFIEIACAIFKYNPAWIQIQPSMLNILLDQYAANRDMILPNDITYVETFGEIQTETIKNKFNAIFPRVMLGNMYGIEECNSIAIQCPCGKMHVLSNNVYLEIEKGTIGKLLVTNLYNRVMPTIRYSTGDIVDLSINKCNCGLEGQTIDIIYGRITDLIILQNEKHEDKILSEYTLSHYVSVINNTLNYPIVQYRFKYNKSISRLECHFVLNPQFAWKNRIMELFDEHIAKDYGINMRVDYKFYNKLFDINDNKYRVLEILGV